MNNHDGQRSAPFRVTLAIAVFAVGVIAAGYLSVPQLLQVWQAIALTFVLIAGSASFLVRSWLRALDATNAGIIEPPTLIGSSLQQYHMLARNSNDIILLIMEDGRIVSANESAALAYGYPLNELIGMNIRSIRSPETLKDLDLQMAQIAAKGGMRFETAHRRKDGHRFPVEASARLIEIEGRKYFQSVIHDITERKKEEHRLTRLNDCFLAFGSDAVHNINSLVELCGEMLGADTSLYNRLDGGLLCSIGQWGTPEGYRAQDKPDGHLCYDLIKGGREELMLVRDLPATGYYASDPNVRQYDLKTYVGKAVRFGQENIGSLCAVFQRDFVPEPEDEKLMSIIAAAIGVEENRRRKEEALRESEERYRRLVDFSPDAIAVHSSGRLVFVNQAGIRLIGAKELNDLVGKPILDIVHSDYRELVISRTFQQTGNESEQPFVEEKFVRLDGSAVDVEVASTPIMYKGKSATLVVARDLGDRKRAQQELVRLRKAVESSGEIIFTTDSEGIITFVNPEFTKLYGYRPEEVVGRVTPRILKSGLLDQTTYHEFWKSLVRKQVFKGELVNRTKDGRRLIVEGSVSPIIGERDTILGYLAVQRDITVRKQTEDALRKSEASYRGLFNSVIDAIYIQDKDGKFLDVNQGAVDMYGYPREFFIGKTPADIAAPGKNDIAKTLEAVTRTFAGEPQRFEWWGERKNGEVFPQEIRLNRSVYFGKEVVVALGQDITERTKAVRALQDSEERYKVLFNSNPHPMWVYDLETLRFLAVNEAAVAHYGYSEEDFLSMTLEDIRFHSGPSALGIGVPVQEGSRRHRRKDGSIIDVDIVSHKVEFAGRRADLVLATDITERKRAEEALRRSELRFRGIWESSMDGMRLLDRQGTIVMVNDAFCRLTGKEEVELVGKPFASAYEPESSASQEQDMQTFRQLFEMKAFERSQEVEIPVRQGKRIQVELSNSFLETENEPPLLLSIFRDITGRREAEQKLRESEEKFRTLSEQSPNMIYINKGGKVVYVNQRCVEMMGFSKEEFYSPSFNFLNLFAPDHIPLVKKNYARHSSGEEIAPYEYVLFTKDKKKIVGLHTTRLINYEGSASILGIVTDITESRLAEEELRKLHRAVDQSPSSIVITDATGAIEYVNPKFTQITGYTQEEVLGKNPSILKTGHTTAENYANLWETIMSGKEWRGEFCNKKKNGETFWEHASISPIRDASGTITHFLGVKEDITDRKMLEQQLWQAQKMESIGTLASGIAHDFNNILGIILGYASMLVQKSVDMDRTATYVDSIVKAAERGADLVRQILTFARKSEFKLEKVDVNSIIGELAMMLGETFPKTITLSLQLEKDLPVLSVDRTQLHQALLNLCVNARDAMADHGSISIETRLVDGATLAFRLPTAPDKVFVEISVSDNGSGMDESTRNRVFEPFFTTKEVGKGTGLGLAVVFGVVQEHQGFVDVTSELGRGSTFRVYLPAPEHAISVSKNAVTDGGDAPGGKETILVVEDEKLMLQLVVTVLERKGYRVLTAMDGEEAWKVHAEHKDEIELVLSDIGLPKLDGWEACQRMKLIAPHLVVLLASGYLDPRLKAEIMKGGVHGFIGKPYSPNEILKRVRDALDLA